MSAGPRSPTTQTGEIKCRLGKTGCSCASHKSRGPPDISLFSHVFFGGLQGREWPSSLEHSYVSDVWTTECISHRSGRAVYTAHKSKQSKGFFFQIRPRNSLFSLQFSVLLYWYAVQDFKRSVLNFSVFSSSTYQCHSRFLAQM